MVAHLTTSVSTRRLGHSGRVASLLGTVVRGDLVDQGPQGRCPRALHCWMRRADPGGMNTDARIVVGYDGTPDSLAALSWATKTASLRDEAVVATTIVD